jgi:hypothetical protein
VHVNLIYPHFSKKMPGITVVLVYKYITFVCITPSFASATLKASYTVTIICKMITSIVQISEIHAQAASALSDALLKLYSPLSKCGLVMVVNPYKYMMKTCTCI